jgi:hypothetical protein
LGSDRLLQCGDLLHEPPDDYAATDDVDAADDEPADNRNDPAVHG